MSRKTTQFRRKVRQFTTRYDQSWNHTKGGSPWTARKDADSAIAALIPPNATPDTAARMRALIK